MFRIRMTQAERDEIDRAAEVQGRVSVRMGACAVAQIRAQGDALSGERGNRTRPRRGVSPSVRV